MEVFEGKFGVSARVLADSVSTAGIRLLTFEITYWRGILAEFNTHRMLARASASSRAIPFTKMQANLTGRPDRFGQANPGMQDKGVDFTALVTGRDMGATEIIGINEELTPEQAWEAARDDAVFWSKALYEAGYHKQVYNRLVEPFQMIKTVVTATEWENFFWLRDDEAADPSIAELARVMREARDASTPRLLLAGEWHLPYVQSDFMPETGMIYFITDDAGVDEFLSLEDAIKVSSARSAAVSFRNVDYGLQKCLEVYERLVGDERKHASALEHQATPIADLDMGYHSGKPVNLQYGSSSWQDGISHCDRSGQLWSGNLRGFIQHRKTVAGENKAGY
jgi:hypothetical protein